MVLAVHPDDETLGVGGLIQQAVAASAAVRVIFVTDGDNNPWPQHVLEKRWRLAANDRQRWGQRRRQEALAALAVLGVQTQHAVFMGLPDQGMTALLETGDENAILGLKDAIAEWQPTILVMPALEDRHPDHSAVAVLAAFALQRVSATQKRPQLLSYLIHGQQSFLADNFAVSLSAQQMQNKRRAILAHKTQMYLSRQRFLDYARSQEVFYAPTPIAHYQPLEEIVINANALKVRIRLTGFMSRIIKPALYLTAEKGLIDQGAQSVRYRLKIKNGQVNIYDCANRAVIGQAAMQVNGNTVQTEIPLSLLANSENAYFKLERRWGFFDAAGWRQVSLKPLAAKLSVNTLAIIPCYDAAEFCEQVILQTVAFAGHVIVIDDGSSDGTAQILAKLAKCLPAKISVITFDANKGKGVALLAGFCHALNNFDFGTLVTLDADGQHPPADIPALVQQIAAGADMAIGERQVDLMPGRSRLGNTLATGAIRWLYPQAPADTQSGMRAFTHELTEEVVRMVPGSRYETEFQILLLALSRQRRIATVAIPTIYIDNNRSSKFRPVTDSLRIAHALIRWRLSHVSAKTT